MTVGGGECGPPANCRLIKRYPQRSLLRCANPIYHRQTQFGTTGLEEARSVIARWVARKADEQKTAFQKIKERMKGHVVARTGLFRADRTRM